MLDVMPLVMPLVMLEYIKQASTKRNERSSMSLNIKLTTKEKIGLAIAVLALCVSTLVAAVVNPWAAWTVLAIWAAFVLALFLVSRVDKE